MQNYDPLVSNGILPLPVNTMLEAGVPRSLANPIKLPNGINNTGIPADIYTPNQEKKSGGWKKWAFGALAVALTLFGLKKFGINPLKKITDSAKVKSLKKFASKQLDKIGNWSIWQKAKTQFGKIINHFKKSS